MRKIRRRDDEGAQLISFETAILSLAARAECVLSHGRGPLATDVGEGLLRASESETVLRGSGDWFETWLSLLLRGTDGSPGTFLPSATVRLLLLLVKLDLSDALGVALALAALAALTGAFTFAGRPTLPVPCFLGTALVFFVAPF